MTGRRTVSRGGTGPRCLWTVLQFLFVVMCLSLCSAAFAAEIFVVDTLVDEDDGLTTGGVSLRDALNASGDGDKIQFDGALPSGGSIILQSALPEITWGIEIDGGSLGLTVSGNYQFPVFTFVGGGASAVRNLSIADGFARGGNGGSAQMGSGGGGAGLGGGIYVDALSGELILENLSFRGNIAQGGQGGFLEGGGIPGAGGGGGTVGDGGSPTRSEVGNGGDSRFDTDPYPTRGINGGLAGCPPESGSFGSGGGGATADCHGADGGFGGGGGGSISGTGGAGGFGGGGGGGAVGSGVGGSWGGTSNYGIGGGGGGLGGALFVRNSVVTLKDCHFFANSARRGGTGGAGRSNGLRYTADGQGKGGAIFIDPSATLFANGCGGDGNYADDSSGSETVSSFSPGFHDEKPVYGLIQTQYPVAESAVPVGASPFSGASMDVTFTFNEGVSGVDLTDFTVLRLDGNSTPTATGVTTNSATDYVVHIGLPPSSAGSFRVRLTDDNSILSLSANAPLGGTSTEDGVYETGDLTFDNVGPEGAFDSVSSPRNAMPYSVILRFDESVSGLVLASLRLKHDGSETPIVSSGAESAITASVDRRTWTIASIFQESDVGDGDYEVILLPGTVADDQGNGNAGSSSGSWTVDSIAPSVDITIDTPFPTRGPQIDFSVQTSESVAPFVLNTNLAVYTSGGSLSYSSVDVTETSPTLSLVSLLGVTGDGSAQIQVYASDPAGNSNYALSNPPVVVDNTAPYLASTSSQEFASGPNVDFYFTISEPVTGLNSAADLEILTDSTYDSIVVTSIPETPPTASYQVSLTNVVGDGTLGFRVPAGTLIDQVGLTNSDIVSSVVLTIDSTAPTIDSIELAGGSPTNDSTLRFNVQFSEPIHRFDTPSWVNVVGDGVSYSNVSVGLDDPAQGDTGYIAVRSVSGNGTISIGVPGGNVTDRAFNPLVEYPLTVLGELDQTAPTVLSMRSATGATLISGPTASVFIELSEPVIGFGKDDIILNAEYSTYSSMSVTQLRSTLYLLTLEGVGEYCGGACNWPDYCYDCNGWFHLGVRSAGATDEVGNALYGQNPIHRFFTIDSDPPKFAFDPLPGALPGTRPSITTNPTTITMRLSEQVVEDITPQDFTLLINGVEEFISPNGEVLVPSPGRYQLVNFFDGIDMQGRYDFRLSNRTIRDPAGNPIATGYSDREWLGWDLDNIRPVVTVESSIATTGPLVSTTLDFYVQFSEEVSGFDSSSDFIWEGDGAYYSNVSFTNFDGSRYLLRFTGVGGSGWRLPDYDLFQFKIKEGAATDATGLTNLESPSATMYIDQTAPFVLSCVPNVSSPTNAESISFTVTFSEPVIPSGGSSESTQNPNYVFPETVGLEQLSPQVIRYDLNNLSGLGGQLFTTDGDISLKLSQYDVRDIVYHRVPEFISDPIHVDRIPPSRFNPNDGYIGDADFGLRQAHPFDMTFRFWRPVVDVSISNLEVLRDGVAVPTTFAESQLVRAGGDSSGTTWYFAPGGGIPLEDGQYQLMLTNTDSIVNSLGSRYYNWQPLLTAEVFATWEIDATRPTPEFTIHGPDLISADQDAVFDIDFGEDVTDFDTSDLIIIAFGVSTGPASLASFSQSVYRATIPISDTGRGIGSSVAIRIAGSRVHDRAGNGNIDSTSPQITLDTINPSIMEVTTTAADPTNADQTSFEVLLNEPTVIADASKVRFELDTGVSINTVSVSAIFGTSAYRVLASGIAGDGEIRMQVDQGAFQDALGNPNNALPHSTYFQTDITIDNSPPSITFSPYNGPDPMTADTYRASFETTEQLVGLTDSNFYVNRGGELSFQSGAFDGFRSYVVSGLDGAGTIQVGVSGLYNVRDSAGNIAVLTNSPPIVERVQPILLLGATQVDVSGGSRREVSGTPGVYELRGTILIRGFSNHLLGRLLVPDESPLIFDENAETLAGNATWTLPSVLHHEYDPLELATNPWTFDGYVLESRTDTPFELTVSTIPLRVCNYRVRTDEIGGNFKSFLSATGLFATPDLGALGFTGLRLGSGILDFDPSSSLIFQGGCLAADQTPRFSPASATITSSSISIPGQVVQGSTPPIYLESLVLQGNTAEDSYAPIDYDGFSIGLDGVAYPAWGGYTLDVASPAFTIPVPFNPNTTFETNVNFYFDGVEVDNSGEFIFGDGYFESRFTNYLNYRCSFAEPSFAQNTISLDEVELQTVSNGTIAISDIIASNLEDNPGIFASEGDLTVNGIKLVLDESAAFYGDSLYADTIYVSNLDGFTIPLKKLRLDGTRFEIGGGGFDIAGLKFVIYTSGDLGSPDGLVIGGELAFPENLVSEDNSGGFGAEVTIKDRSPRLPKVELEAINFCLGGDGAIGGTGFSLAELCFGYESGPPKFFTGSTTFGIPRGFELSAGFEILGGIIDSLTVGLGFPEPGRPIGSTGAFMQSITGSLYNLSQSRVTEILETKDGPRQITWIPPVTLRGEIEATAGPEIPILDVAAVTATAGITVNEISLGIDGTVTVVIFEIGSASAKITWGGPPDAQGFSFSGKVIYYGIIAGEFDGFVAPGGYARASAKVRLGIPDDVPVFGGLTFGSVGAGLEIDPEKNPKFKAWATASLPLLVYTAHVTVTFDSNGNVGFDVSRGTRVADWEVPYWQPVPVSDELHRDKNGNPTTSYVSVLRDFDQSFKAYANEGKFRQTPRGAGTAIDLPTTASLEGTVVRLTYEDPAGNPEFTLTSPSGKTITPANLPSDPPSPDVFGVWFENPSVRDASYFMIAEETGTYRATILYPETLGQYAIEVLSRNTEPTFAFEEVVVNGSDLAFRWSAFDPDGEARIDLFAGADREASQGIRLIADIAEVDGSGMAVFDLANSPLSPGWYWPFAVIDDSRNAPVTVVAETPIYIPSSEAPIAVQNIDVVSFGDQLFVSWYAVKDPDLEFYNLSYTDQPGSGSYKFDQVVAKEYTSALLENTDPNSEYQVTVTPILTATTSAAARAEGLNAIQDLADSLVHLRGVRTDDRQIVLDMLDAKSRGGTLTVREPMATTDQVVELVRSREIGKTLLGPSEEVQQLLQAERAKRKGSRSRAVEEYFVPAPILAYDVARTGVIAGANQPPVFTGSPTTVVAAGTDFDWTATAYDPEGSAVSFQLIDGPPGFAVSQEGIVFWSTSESDVGTHEVIIAAIDLVGSRSTLSWDLTVSNVYQSLSLFEIISDPPTDVVPGDLYAYSPELVNTFVSPTNPVVWSLVDGPPGMIVDSASGAIYWQTLDYYMGAPRVILRVEQSSLGDPLLDIQEYRINVSRLGDSITGKTTVGDGDSDGVQSETEDLAPSAPGSTVQPSGDGNGDGIPDSEQQNVVSLRNGAREGASAGEYLTIVSAPGTVLSNVRTSAAREPYPVGTKGFPVGVVSFTLSGRGVVSPPGTNSVKIMLQSRPSESIGQGYYLDDGIAYSSFVGPTPPYDSGAQWDSNRTFTLELLDDNGSVGDLSETGDTNSLVGILTNPGGPNSVNASIWLIR
ncbi:fibronectin type III domain-containing protein [bacterium]|nr:fibronectin type III domain-containing protein [bacterium]